MKKTTRKTSYTSPEVELLVVRSEGSLLNVSGPGSGYNNSGNAGNSMSEDGNYTYSF